MAKEANKVPAEAVKPKPPAAPPKKAPKRVEVKTVTEGPDPVPQKPVAVERPTCPVCGNQLFPAGTKCGDTLTCPNCSRNVKV